MRLIDADALKSHLDRLECNGGSANDREIVDKMLHKVFLQIIDDEPTIDAQPVKRGRWYYDNAKDQCFCTECGNYTYIGKFENEILSNYCPDCGADMREEAHNVD